MSYFKEFENLKWFFRIESEAQKLWTFCRATQPMSNRWGWNLCLLSHVQLSSDFREYLFLQFLPFHLISLCWLYLCIFVTTWYLLLFSLFYFKFVCLVSVYQVAWVLFFSWFIKGFIPLKNFFTFSISIVFNYLLLFLFPLRVSKRGLEMLEQSFGLYGRRRGWDVSREQHRNMYII